MPRRALPSPAQPQTHPRQQLEAIDALHLERKSKRVEAARQRKHPGIHARTVSGAV